MTVTPGKQARACLDVFAFILSLLLIALQLGILDYYFLTNLSEKWWYAWIAADVLVLLIMFWILILALRYNQRSMEELCTAGNYSVSNIHSTFFKIKLRIFQERRFASN